MIWPAPRTAPFPSPTPAASYSDNTNVGTATASYSFAGDANHDGSSDSKPFGITKASSTTVVSCPANEVYTGTAQEPCTVAVTGASLSLTPAASYSDNTNVGTATASYSFAGDANHDGSSDSKPFGITKASSTTVVSCPANEVYTGTAQEPCTVAVTGASLSLTPAASYSDNTNVGTATASYSFAGDANHDGSSDSKPFGITKASSTTVVSCPANEVYTGTAQEPCTVAVTGASLSLTPAASYSDNTNVGTATASYSFAGDANHDGSSDSKPFGITKASSTTVVSCPANEVYTGTAQEPCTVAVTGASLSLTPAASYSDNTNVGTATASYSFAGDANHDGSSDSKPFGITKASSTTVVSCPANEVYTGTAQEPCTVAVTGASLSLTPAASYSDNTNVGTATASYSFAGDANHEGSSDSKTFGITKASSTTVVTCPASAVYTGAAQTPCTAQANGAGMTSVDVSASLVYSNNTSAGAATVNASWAGDANHAGSNGSGGFTIDKASSAV